MLSVCLATLGPLPGLGVVDGSKVRQRNDDVLQHLHSYAVPGAGVGSWQLPLIELMQGFAADRRTKGAPKKALRVEQAPLLLNTRDISPAAAADAAHATATGAVAVVV